MAKEFYHRLAVSDNEAQRRDMFTGVYTPTIYTLAKVINIYLQIQGVYYGIETTFCNVSIYFSSFSRTMSKKQLNIS
jgi:hypothetical protein